MDLSLNAKLIVILAFGLFNALFLTVFHYDEDLRGRYKFKLPKNFAARFFVTVIFTLIAHFAVGLGLVTIFAGILGLSLVLVFFHCEFLRINGFYNTVCAKVFRRYRADEIDSDVHQ